MPSLTYLQNSVLNSFFIPDWLPFSLLSALIFFLLAAHIFSSLKEICINKLAQACIFPVFSLVGPSALLNFLLLVPCLFFSHNHHVRERTENHRKKRGKWERRKLNTFFISVSIHLFPRPRFQQQQRPFIEHVTQAAARHCDSHNPHSCPLKYKVSHLTNYLRLREMGSGGHGHLGGCEQVLKIYFHFSFHLCFLFQLGKLYSACLHVLC